MVLRALSLCSGIGGLDLALQALGVVSVGYVERDAYAASVLVARMADSSLDRAPVWPDLERFDAGAWRGRVDLVSAGYPCQPFSQAGKRLGAADERHLWPAVRLAVERCEPRVVVLENVVGHVRRGLSAVLADLAALGFVGSWGVVGASACGAPHRRLRLFVLAHRDRDAVRELRRWGRGPDGPDATEPRFVGAELADGDGARRVVVGQQAKRESPSRPVADGRGRERACVADAVRARRAGPEPVLCGSSRRIAGEAWPWPPGPGDRVGWETVLASRPDLAPAVRWTTKGLPRLNPAFVEWLMGFPEGWTVPLPGREALDRADRLRCLGNAVVPAQAALAVSLLAERCS